MGLIVGGKIGRKVSWVDCFREIVVNMNRGIIKIEQGIIWKNCVLVAKRNCLQGNEVYIRKFGKCGMEEVKDYLENWRGREMDEILQVLEIILQYQKLYYLLYLLYYILS